MIPRDEYQQVKPMIKRMNPHLSFDDFDEDWKRDRVRCYCMRCERMFKNHHGLNIHMGKMHPPSVYEFVMSGVAKFLGSRIL